MAVRSCGNAKPSGIMCLWITNWSHAVTCEICMTIGVHVVSGLFRGLSLDSSTSQAWVEVVYAWPMSSEYLFNGYQIVTLHKDTKDNHSTRKDVYIQSILPYQTRAVLQECLEVICWDLIHIYVFMKQLLSRIRNRNEYVVTEDWSTIKQESFIYIRDR